MSKKEEEELAQMDTMGDPTDSRTASAVAPSAHTPTPWYWAGDGRIIEGEGYIVADPEGGVINDEDAEFIVRACNAHDDLLAALKMIRANRQHHEDGDICVIVKCVVCGEDMGWPIATADPRPTCEECVCDAAIAKAEGR